MVIPSPDPLDTTFIDCKGVPQGRCNLSPSISPFNTTSIGFCKEITTPRTQFVSCIPWRILTSAEIQYTSRDSAPTVDIMSASQDIMHCCLKEGDGQPCPLLPADRCSWCQRCWQLDAATCVIGWLLTDVILVTLPDEPFFCGRVDVLKLF